MPQRAALSPLTPGRTLNVPSTTTACGAPSRMRRVRWRLQLLGYQMLAAFLWRCGHAQALRLGEMVGRLIPCVAPRRLRIATNDLRRVFGNTKSAGEIEAIARASLRTLGGNMAELLWLRRARPQHIAALAELGDGARRRLDEAVARGRGTILIGIHFGRWELMFLGFNLSGRRFALVTRPLANPYLDAYLAEIRCRLGNTVVHTLNKQGMHEVLTAAETLLISMDHRGEPRRAATVNFLGQQTALTTGIARFALRYRATLLPIYPIPLPGGRLRIEIGPLLEYAPTGDLRRDVDWITQRSADVLGALIREHPQYWMWSHKRLWDSR